MKEDLVKCLRVTNNQLTEVWINSDESLNVFIKLYQCQEEIEEKIDAGEGVFSAAIMQVD